MKKIIALFLLIFSFTFSQKAYSQQDLTQRKDIFTPAFQLVWNDFKNLVSTKEVKFIGNNPDVLKVLNNSKFSTDDIDENSYFKIVGLKSYDLKAKILREIYEKFSEKSKMLENINWENKNNNEYILYALLKKDVEFPKEFNVLDKMSFNKSKQKYNYFGFENGARKYKNQVRPLYYRNKNEYAISMSTTNGDSIILYRISSNDSVDDLYVQLQKHLRKPLGLGDNDKLYVPEINISEQIEYKQLCNKKIKNSKMVISKAIDDVQFVLNNKGAQLRNEAVIEAVKMSMPIAGRGTVYDFSKPFVLYMVEKGKQQPYFAIKVKDARFLVK